LVILKFQKIIQHGFLKNYVYWSPCVDEVIETNHEKFVYFLRGFIFLLSFNFYFPKFRKLNIKQRGLLVASHLPTIQEIKKKLNLALKNCPQKNKNCSFSHLIFSHLDICQFL
jgi:hypothetical protein